MDWKDFATKKPLNAYSIFCGVLEYHESILKKIKSGERYGFDDWEIHVNPDNIDSEKIIKGFNRFYYESFVKTIFPDSDKQNFNSDFAKKTFRLSRKIDKIVPLTIRQGKSEHVFNVKFEYLDLFFFPREIAFYCFKCDLSEFSYDEITLINSYLRNAGVTEDTEFLYDFLSFLEPSDDTSSNTNSLSFGNKLKVFLLVEHEEDMTGEEESMLLYDLGVCAPIGSASGTHSYFQPSEEYYRELITENRISVFNNWSALSLFDTFTGLFRKGALNNFVWENGYFNLLYLQSLYVKHYLFKINKIFHSKDAGHQELEDEFFEFNKYYNPSHISYNFLPSLIFNKIRDSLAISDELKQLTKGIKRASQKSKEKSDRVINKILTIIGILAVFSVIWDISEWINKLFSGSTASYNIMSGSLTLVVLFIFGIFFIRNYRK